MIIGIDASRANHDQKTGVEWYAFFLIQELKKITDPRTTHVILYADRPLQGELAVLPAHWSAKILHWPPQRLWTHIRLSWEMLTHPPDVLFIPAHVPPLIHPKKTVMTVHDIAALRFPESYNRFERWYSLWSARYAVKKMYKIITPSQFTKKELLEYVPGASTARIDVVSHGHNQHSAPAERIGTQEVLNKYHITQPFLLSIGRLEEKKNTKRIIQAFDLLKKEFPEDKNIQSLSLVLVGKPGHGYEEVQSALQESPNKKHIVMPGWVDEKDVAVLLETACVFVFPSLYEGFGLPVLEAFAAGTPVVASKGSSLEEVGGSAAIYVDPMAPGQIVDAIKMLVSDQDNRALCIKRGRERVGLFSWQSCAQQTLEILSS